jgi:hypothetical protein
MDPGRRAYLIDAFEAGRWLEPAPPELVVFAWGFVPNEAGGLHPLRLRVLPTEPRLTLSEWVVDGRPLVLTTWECTSMRQAREQLLSVLGEFMKPPVRHDGPLGEVTYTVPPDDAAMVLARGNLVLLARNGTPDVVSARRLLEPIDDELKTPRGYAIELPLEPDTPLQLAPPNDFEWVHIVADGGEIVVRDGQAFFRDNGRAVTFVKVERVPHRPAPR